MNSSTLTLAIVLPCFNEQEVLPESIAILEKNLQNLIDKNIISKDSFCYFVDDGSQDNTWNIIVQNNHNNPNIKGLKLVANCGHQNALMAGLSSVMNKVDCAISMDVDLQDDINVIEKMINHYIAGNEIVFGVRNNRDSDSKFKRISAEKYYSFMRFLGIKILPNHADFRLMGKKSLQVLSQYKEYHLFLRGLVMTLGFRYEIVEYKRLERQAGETKYPLTKMLSLAWNGLTSFSILPLRLFTIIGLSVFLMSVVVSCWVLIVKFFGNQAVPGWASTVLPIYFLGGIQLLGIGLLGEYLGKIFIEVKSRPRFIKEKELE